MKSEVMQNMPWEWMPVLSLIIFVLVFLGAFFWSFRPGSKELYEQITANALSDGQKVNSENKGSNNE
ncbi:cbb3-type cytochrome c oxidase subunit 3 [Halobacteriovorax sp.]|uniref:cbb3-type cytochrome c oxidase subunit 3 n=1 Tax=Halobacteriovorax sp. TaxID=2020862 RepID=UPI003AF289D9